MPNRTLSTDAVLAAVGVAGLAGFLLLYASVFPQANVRLQVTRAQARDIATEFLDGQSADLSGFRESIVFFGDDVALNFLQRHVGLEQAGELANSAVPVWTWRLRWFIPQEKEEWNVWINVDGEIVGFNHIIEETVPGEDFDSDQALSLAQRFLASQGYDLAEWERVGESSQRRDNRTDHYFTWDQSGSEIEWRPDDPDAGVGTLRLLVRIQGEELGSFNRFLRVPEEFERNQSEVLSVGQVLALGAFGITALLSLVAVGIAIVRVRKGDLDWRPAVSLGVLVGGMLLLFNVLSWPTLKAAYPTEISWPAYIGILLIGVVLLTALYGAIVLFTAAAGASLSEEVFPGRLEGYRELATGQWFHAGLARSSLRGYGLAFGFIGYLTVFYWFAQRYLGAWLPAEGPYSQIFDLSLPFLAPLAISLVAAISEEVTYRLFGISLFKRYTGSTVVALLIPAVIWAFAHSTYPVYPVYLRGIELTIGGIIFGIAFLRLGLVTCIVAHYVVDAFLLGAPLVATENPVYVTSGIIAIGLALVPAVLGLLARRNAPPQEPATVEG